MNRKKRKKKNLLQGLLQQNRQQNLYGLKKNKDKGSREDALSAKLSFEEYRERYLSHSQCSNGKSGFTINSEVLQLLRDVLRDVRANTTLTAYIENILLEHLKENQAMLNKTAAQYKRNQTLNL